MRLQCRCHHEAAEQIEANLAGDVVAMARGSSERDSF